MFTGIIEKIGQIDQLNRDEKGGAHLSVFCNWTDLSMGESVCTNGVCLTVNHIFEKGFGAYLSPETVNITNFRSSLVGDKLNLERSLSPNKFMSGHMVQGHVEGTLKLIDILTLGDSWELKFSLPEGHQDFFVNKGSVALNGISLTTNAVDKVSFKVSVIPFTMTHTNLSEAKIGDELNFETDIVARYILAFADKYIPRKNND